MNKRLSKSLSGKRVEKGFNCYLCRWLKYLNMKHDTEVASASNTTPGAVSARAINLRESHDHEKWATLSDYLGTFNFTTSKLATIQAVHFETILEPIQTEFRPQKTLKAETYGKGKCCKVCSPFISATKQLFHGVENNSLCWLEWSFLK